MQFGKKLCKKLHKKLHKKRSISEVTHFSYTAFFEIMILYGIYMVCLWCYNYFNINISGMEGENERNTQF